MAKFTKIFCMAGVGILLLSLFACEQKTEPSPPPAQVKVVKKSIDSSKRAASFDKTAAAMEPSSLEKKRGNGPASPSQSPQVESQAVVAPAAEKLAQNRISSQVVSSSTSIVDNPEQVKSDTAAKTVAQALTLKKYDTKGRIDPFIPLLSEKKEEPVAAEEERPKRILTPLEKMELSQIKLVAVVEMKNRFSAMVEEASGKGYPVEIGTYMGRNGGRVSAITRDGIVVKEYVKDFKGNRRERIQEIKFHKDEGGE